MTYCEESCREDYRSVKPLTPNQEAILPEDEKTLLKAGFIGNALYLNSFGTSVFIQEVLYPKFKQELVELAKKKLTSNPQS